MDPLITRKQVSEIFSVSKRTVRNWEKQDKIPVACKLGKQVKYRKADVEKLLSTPKQASNGCAGSLQ